MARQSGYGGAATGVLLALVAAASCGKDGGGGTDPTPAVTTGTISGLCTDGAGNPLPGVEVSTSPSSGFAVSDASGAYELAGIAAGTYDMVASRGGYETAEKQDVTLSAGGTALVDFQLVEIVLHGAISGLVTDAASGAPVVGAAVATLPATTAATTAADGSFSIGGLEAGSYQVTVSAEGYEDRVSEAQTVTAGGSTNVDLQLVAIVIYESTCAGCHVDGAKLLADLAIDPPPDATHEGGSAGEG